MYELGDINYFLKLFIVACSVSCVVYKCDIFQQQDAGTQVVTSESQRTTSVRPVTATPVKSMTDTVSPSPRMRSIE